MTTRQKLEQKIRDEIADLERRLKMIESVPGLESIELDASFFGDQIDFDHLEHDKVVTVMKALNAGKWSKTPADNATVHYETEFSGVKVRCYQGKPPPNCKIVEELQDVPEQIIPAKTITIRKLVCQ